MSATTYRGRTIKVVETLSGALSATVDGRRTPIAAIFAEHAIEMAKSHIDAEEVRE